MTVINVPLFLVILIQYSQRHSMINHCDVSDYCISITKTSGTSITVIYHAMSPTTVSVSLRRMVRLSQWFIMLYLWLYCISITMKSDRSITVIYQAMSLTTVSVSLRSMVCLSQWFIMLYLWLYCISKKSGTFITVIYPVRDIPW
jgi:hypothetical protein